MLTSNTRLEKWMPKFVENTIKFQIKDLRNIHASDHFHFAAYSSKTDQLRQIFLAYGTRILASTSCAGKLYLTPPCKTGRVR